MANASPAHTPEGLRRLLRYDPHTGKLYWRARDISLCKSERAMAAFNSQFAGKEAFTADNGDGYLCSHLAGRTMRAHRVIWAIVHGRWQARIVAHGKRRSLGVFDTQEEARDAYLRASKKYHGEYGWRS